MSCYQNVHPRTPWDPIILTSCNYKLDNDFTVNQNIVGYIIISRFYSASVSFNGPFSSEPRHLGHSD